MSISFTEDMLKEAVIKADIYEIETLPTDDEIEYEFSNEFERKMERLIRRSKTRNLIGGMAFLRRRVVALIAVNVNIKMNKKSKIKMYKK